MTRYERVILLGIDGLDPRLLKMLMDEGAAPSFAKLWREGSGGRLRSVQPAQSPVVWTTLATGTNPGKHGVFDFIHRDPERPLPYLSICRSGPGGLLGAPKYVKARRNAAFWDVLSESDVPVTVLRWPVTFPPDRVNGRMLAGLGVPDLLGTLGSYTFYTDDATGAGLVPPERLVKVEVRDSRVETVLTGPRYRGVTGQSAATLPLTVDWRGNPAGGGVTVTLGGASVSLEPRTWSDWVRVRFSVGALKKVSGMVKLYLDRREPSLRLYVSPVELDPADPALPLTSPEGYAGELAASIGAYHTLGMPEDTKALNEGCVGEEAFVEQCNEVTQERLRMFWREFERFTGGVFAFVFDTSDRVQHMFWGENVVDEAGNVTRIGPRIREHYVQMDRFLGELLARMKPGTALFVFSDHGFVSYDYSFDLNAWLTAEGYMKLSADPAGKAEDEAALYRLVDWTKTQAYGCGFSSLYLNLKGREGNGIVEPARAEELAREIKARLASYVDAGTGRRPVEAAYGRDEIYSGPQAREAPDLVLGFRPGYRMSWQTAVGGVCDRVVSRNEKHWNGDHIVDAGFVPATVLTNAPLDLAEASALDVAPTALALVGLEPPSDCDGRVLRLREA